MCLLWFSHTAGSTTLECVPAGRKQSAKRYGCCALAVGCSSSTFGPPGNTRHSLPDSGCTRSPAGGWDGGSSRPVSRPPRSRNLAIEMAWYFLWVLGTRASRRRSAKHGGEDCAEPSGGANGHQPPAAAILT